VISSNYKLGLIGRNGRGKTTLLKILNHELEYQGRIITELDFSYYPQVILDENKSTLEVIEDLYPNFLKWKLERELNLLQIDLDVLDSNFKILSSGLKNKILLACLFLNDNNFLLIDEPTNHLDKKGIITVSNYLKNKQGFIVVSHLRNFLDAVIDHVVYLGKNEILLTKGNFSTWYQNKERKDNFEIKENQKIKSEILRLDNAFKIRKGFSEKAEKEKYGDGHVDKGFLGHKAEKLMRRAKSIEKMIDSKKETKKSLLKDVEETQKLKINYEPFRQKDIFNISNLSYSYDQKKNIFSNVSINLKVGEILLISGNNGSGKSTLIKILNRELNNSLSIPNDLKISYVPQIPEFSGTIKDIINKENIDYSSFCTILSKFNFPEELFTKETSSFSLGEKKKIALAISLSKSANIYLWDEPLNNIDIFSRIQIENLIKETKITLIVIEHDESFLSELNIKTLTL
jgi:lincosamide and streptogramin A transport system ATP-binding/permease protein